MSLARAAEGPDVAEFVAAWRSAGPRELSYGVLDEVDSTNRLARTVLEQHFAEGEEPRPFALLALAQSAGIGRHQRRWESPARLGVYATISLPVDAAERLVVLPLACAVALAERLRACVGESLLLKWPNDLLVDGRKLGGVLCEALARAPRRPWAIVGFGVNHGQTAANLPDPRATSLRLVARGELPGLARLACELVGAAWRALSAREDPASVVDRYRELSAHHLGEPLVCQVDDRRVAGRFAGIDEHGFLRLETTEGVLELRSGEVREP